jgi:hypothetical protein
LLGPPKLIGSRRKAPLRKPAFGGANWYLNRNGFSHPSSDVINTGLQPGARMLDDLKEPF